MQEFKKDGTFIRVFRHTMRHPYSVAVLPDGDVLVGDFLGSRIERFSADGSYKSVFAHVASPYGLAVDRAHGRVFVTTGDSTLVGIFDLHGRYLGTFGGSGTGNGQFTFASGVATDVHGSVYVADLDGDRVQQFTPNGEFLGTFGTYGYRFAPGNFYEAWGIAVSHRDGTIYVADQKHGLLQEWRP